MKPLVSIVMGSKSDFPVMSEAANILEAMEIPFEISVVSAHRTPERLYKFANEARERGVLCVIAGAGGAAHLPGMIASSTILPVIGVPIKSSNSIDGWDSVLSILQMPAGVPVATVALNGASNAGILAAQIISLLDAKVGQKLTLYKENLKDKVMQSIKDLDEQAFKFRISNTF